MGYTGSDRTDLRVHRWICMGSEQHGQNIVSEKKKLKTRVQKFKNLYQLSSTNLDL
jgi:hypothetical protein